MYEEFDEYDLKSKVDWKIWKRLIVELKKFKKPFFIGVISISITALLEVMFFYLISNYAIKEILENGNTKVYYWLIPTLVIFTVLNGFAVLVFCRSTADLELYTTRELSTKTFNHLHELPFSFYDKSNVGWLLARCTSDSLRVSEIISWGLVDFVWAFFKLIFVVLVMSFLNIYLALIILIFVPLMIFISYKFNPVIINFSRKVRKANSKITGGLNEGISGAKTSKSLALEEKNTKGFSLLSRNFKKASVTSTIVSSFYFNCISILAGCTITAVVYLGGNLVIKDVLDVATLFLFVTYTMSFLDPVLNVALFSNDLKHAQVCCERLFNVIDLKPQIMDTKEVIEKYGTITEKKTENWENLTGDIEFKDVTFYYNKNDLIVLNKFNLKVKAGESIGIVGRTGAGKSTIINLLCRFYEPSEGEILIDNKNYKDRSISWLHSKLGYVLQTPQLFTGSILDNVKYGKIDATFEDVKKACDLVGASEFIEKLENKYDTLILEGGNNLSLGQKQLISFARAIIADPRILILDEATSSIDTETEKSIQSAIKKIMQNRTSFIIAHRLSTIVDCDKIIVLDKGNIIEMGSHSELMNQKGEYYKLYSNQFINDEMKNLDFI
jgi:ATP-binding cassette subfamily B protein